MGDEGNVQRMANPAMEDLAGLQKQLLEMTDDAGAEQLRGELGTTMLSAEVFL
jgi:hypothetical protein